MLEFHKFQYVRIFEIPINCNFGNSEISQIPKYWKFLYVRISIRNSDKFEIPIHQNLHSKFSYADISVMSEFLIQWNFCWKFQYIKISEILICGNFQYIRISDMSEFLKFQNFYSQNLDYKNHTY